LSAKAAAPASTKGVIAVAPTHARRYRDFGERKPQVLIAEPYAAQYRHAFYEGLRARLAHYGIGFDLVYGDPTPDDAKKSDAIALDWAIHLPSRYFGFGEHKLTYQPIVRMSSSYDLVIVSQENKLLANAVLLGMNGLGMTRVAFWGHGKSFQGSAGFLARTMKRALVPRVHWWFAYNELSAAVVSETGFPDERITRVMNTIDSESLRADLAEITPAEVERQRQKLRLGGRNVCIYVGGMYDKKRLSFLLAACERVRRKVPDFEIVFLGGGVDRPFVDQFAARHPWARACGPTFGRAKAVNLKLAKLFLMPGLVGLAIIDTFAAQVPLVTTCVPYHSPEIDYLISGVNGEMVPSVDNVDDYADTIVSLLFNEDRLATLRSGCRDAATKYSMGSMVDRFADGILGALAS
jgi:glycosyltransferase involved in cell wall biosynthesis